MTKIASLGRGTRAIAVLGLVLTLQAASPARADPQGPPQASSKLLPLPPPGTHRLIRIGPQALVSEDDRGLVTMVDESPPPPRRGRSVAAVTLILGIVGVGSFLMFNQQQDLLEGRPGVTPGVF
jgi:hypothetical protein